MEVWNAAQFFTMLAWDGVHGLRNDAVPAGIGGDFIVVNSRLAPHVTQHGSILENQGV